MTTAIATPAIPTSHRLTLAGAIRSEWIKATSLRSIRWSIALALVLSIGLSFVMALALRTLSGPAGDGAIEITAEASDVAGIITGVTSFPANFLCLIFAVLGVFVFSSEYSSGMILSTLAATPRRGLVLTSKALVLTVISGNVAIINMVAGTALAVWLNPEARPALFTTPVLTSLAGTVAFLVVIALMAFALGGILRSTAGAITVMVVLVFVAPTVLQVLSQVTDWSWVPAVTNYLPTTLAQTLSYGVGSDVPAQIAEATGVATPGYGEALFALAVWVVVPMFVATKLFFDRDAK